MTKEEFIQKIKEGLPIERQSEDFLKDIKAVYSEFVSDVSGLVVDFFGDENVKSDILQTIKEHIAVIEEVLKTYYGGCHGEAFVKLKSNLLSKAKDSLDLKVINIENTLEAGTYFYRARKNDGTIKSYKDMFHIPNNKREIVKTERFSVSGYPCLYLGNTVYDCWEEMGRLSFEELFFSGYRVVNEFKVYDLRKPKIEEFDKDQLLKTLIRLVYVIACQFKVLHPDKPFVPEYIFPQLLLELVVTTNRERKKTIDSPYSLPWGIIYTSTHLSKDFKYQEEYLVNVAIPVVDTEKEQCGFLSSLFEISEPICYRYEELKETMGIPFGNIDDDRDEIKKEYDQTKLGFIEKRIKNDASFHQMYV